jgi:hypothetical protein
VGSVDRHSLIPQPLDEYVGQRPRVLRDQDPHTRPPADPPPADPPPADPAKTGQAAAAL